MAVRHSERARDAQRVDENLVVGGRAMVSCIVDVLLTCIRASTELGLNLADCMQLTIHLLYISASSELSFILRLHGVI